MEKSAYLKEIDRIIKNGKYQDTWESLSQYRIPEWYKDTKLGIFIHWGVYSVPAFGSEWYSRNMYIQGSPEYKHHIETYGPHKDFGYKDFIPMFKAEKFDPEAWADLFQQAGAKYVVPVAEHHDGFQMYKSELSHWNAYEMGPKRDVLGELETAFEKRGMITGASSHRVEHWFFMGHGKEFDSDVKGPLQRGDLYWPAMPEGGIDDLLGAFFGAVVLAVGIALVFRAGATTGGTDILVRLLKLRYKHIETGKLFFCTDLVVVICSMVVFRNVNTGLYALLSIMVFAIVFDVVLYGSDTAKMVYVVSEKEERIARRIMDELEIGVTYVHGQGAYTEKEKRVILCAAKKQLFPKVKEIVKEEDPQAFLIVSSASDIYGEGFKDHFAEEF